MGRESERSLAYLVAAFRGKRNMLLLGVYGVNLMGRDTKVDALSTQSRREFLGSRVA